MKFLIGLFTAGVAIYLLLCGYLYFAQRSLMCFPTPARDGRPHLVLAHDDQTLRVATREHVGPRAVLYFGGNAEDVGESIEELAVAFPDAAIFGMHYRGYGGSSGEPSERALVSDALALHAHVAATHARITVIGRSLGSGIALQLARARPVERLVLVTPYHSMRDLAQHSPRVPGAMAAARPVRKHATRHGTARTHDCGRCQPRSGDPTLEQRSPGSGARPRLHAAARDSGHRSQHHFGRVGLRRRVGGTVTFAV